MGPIHFETRVPLKEIMRHNPTTTGMESNVAQAAAKMCKDEVGSCIVLHNNIPLGIITEQDLNCKVVANDLMPSSVYVSEVMSTPLITINVDETVGDAAHMMIENKVRRLPVVDDDEVVGIVTVRDLLNISNEMNEIMSELVFINREADLQMGLCDGCGKMSDDLKNVDGAMLCSGCRMEERLI